MATISRVRLLSCFRVAGVICSPLRLARRCIQMAPQMHAAITTGHNAATQSFRPRGFWRKVPDPITSPTIIKMLTCAFVLMRSNENKMSDGGPGRVSLGVNVWKSSQNVDAERSAVRSIAWLGVGVASGKAWNENSEDERRGFTSDDRTKNLSRMQAIVVGVGAKRTGAGVGDKQPRVAAGRPPKPVTARTSEKRCDRIFGNQHGRSLKRSEHLTRTR